MKKEEIISKLDEALDILDNYHFTDAQTVCGLLEEVKLLIGEKQLVQENDNKCRHHSRLNSAPDA